MQHRSLPFEFQIGQPSSEMRGRKPASQCGRLAPPRRALHDPRCCVKTGLNSNNRTHQVAMGIGPECFQSRARCKASSRRSETATLEYPQHRKPVQSSEQLDINVAPMSPNTCTHLSSLNSLPLHLLGRCRYTRRSADGTLRATLPTNEKTLWIFSKPERS